jgi:hypothetical protein
MVTVLMPASSFGQVDDVRGIAVTFRIAQIHTPEHGSPILRTVPAPALGQQGMRSKIPRVRYSTRADLTPADKQLPALFPAPAIIFKLSQFEQVDVLQFFQD